MINQKEVHIPYLSHDELIVLNTAAKFSQFKRMSIQAMNNSRISMESHYHQNNNKRHQRVSISSLSSFLFKRKRSSNTSMTSSSSFSTDLADGDCPSPPSLLSPKARKMESLIFEQPERTIRLSLTPLWAV